MSKKVLRPLRWHPQMDELDRLLRELPEDRCSLFMEAVESGDGTRLEEIYQGGQAMAKKPRKPKTEDLTAAIMPLYERQGRKPKVIADELNSREIRTGTGQKWTAENVRKFLDRHLVTDSQHPTTKESDADVLKEMVISYQRGQLRRVIEWYEAHAGKPPTVIRIQGPARFKGERANTGMIVSRLIYDRAKEKLKSDSRIGNSMSRLVEFLLWEYLGSPADLLDEQDQSFPAPEDIDRA